MENSQSYVDIFVSFMTWWIYLVGSASMILKGLEQIARITKTKDDDIALAKARKVVDFLSKLTHSLAMSPISASKTIHPEAKPLVKDPNR